MKLRDLKEALKPFIKECIKEALLEGGILSSVIKEVATGLASTQIVEAREQPAPQPAKTPTFQPRQGNKKNVNETKKKILEAMGQDAYNGVDIFENTAPLAESRNFVEPSTGQSVPGPMAGRDPNDAGIDLSQFGINVK